jgi:hypothetical protein
VAAVHRLTLFLPDVVLTPENAWDVAFATEG